MVNNYLVPIGHRLREIRHSHGMTQEILADRLGVTPKHISHTECGKSSFSIENLIEFCNIFNCSLDYILLGKQDIALSRLPKEIIQILYSGNDKEISRLIKYLNVYIELINNNNK